MVDKEEGAKLYSVKGVKDYKYNSENPGNIR